MKCIETGEDALSSLFLKLSHLYFRKSFDQLTGLGLHPGQLPLINLLGEEAKLSQKEISDRLHVKPPTVAVSIRRLENVGLIKKNSDSEDQRVKRICLSSKGEELYQKISAIINHNEEILENGLSESEKCLLRRFLLQLINNLEES